MYSAADPGLRLDTVARLQHQSSLRLGLDPFPVPEHRLVLTRTPEAHQILVVFAGRMTGLPGWMNPQGVLQIAEIDKMELPRKVWTDCFRCPKFPNCDETALIYHAEEQV